jgi:hypothetical protein
MRVLKSLLIFGILSPSFTFAEPIIWNAEVAKDNARATVSLIRSVEPEIRMRSQSVRTTDLPTIDRLISAFKEQSDMNNPSVASYTYCLDALESFRPYLTVSLKPDTPGHRESMSSSKKAYSDDLMKCEIAAKSSARH